MNKTLFSLCLALGCFASAADGGTAPVNPPGATPATAMGGASNARKNDTPVAACENLVQTAKNKNFDEFMKMTTDLPAQERKNIKNTQNNFQKMGRQYLERLQDLTCGNEVIAKDHAVVETESNGQRRLIPFLKTEEGWKFDMRTYQSFYQTEEAPSQKSKK